jgi:RNA polymerase sigma-70 factor (ECF subfamily)
MTDASLLSRCRAGDPDAFGELIVRHYPVAYRTARAIVRSHLDAEDALQDAFVRAYTRLGSFRGEAAFRTWLVTIVRNEAITRLRAERRRSQTMPPADEVLIGQFASRERSPEDQVLDGERRRHLSRCIDTLPDRLREALRLAHSGRHTYQEMGTLLGAPTGTIKSRVAEARRLLAGRLRNVAS